MFQRWLLYYVPSSRFTLEPYIRTHNFAAWEGRLWLYHWVRQNHGPSIIDEALPHSGATPLIYAVQGGHIETVRWLLQQVASPDATGYFIGERPQNHKDDPGLLVCRHTALSLAATKRKEIFEILLQFGAYIDFQNSDGDSFLLLAALATSCFAH